jgi:hypothetical protein
MRDCPILYHRGWRKGRPGIRRGKNGEFLRGTKQPPEYLEYRGYKIEVSKGKHRPKYKAFVTSIKHQIDIVENVKLKPYIKQYFRNKRIMVRPNIKSRGRFKWGESAVLLKPVPFPKEKPILLHEFLHAYHNEMMPQGRHNADIIRYFQAALKNQLYPEGAYLLLDHAEFFAVTGATFLHGTTNTPPYTREAIQDLQPDYYQFLTTVFNVE